METKKDIKKKTIVYEALFKEHEIYFLLLKLYELYKAIQFFFLSKPPIDKTIYREEPKIRYIIV